MTMILFWHQKSVASKINNTSVPPFITLWNDISKEVTLYIIIYCILQDLENKLKQPTAYTKY